MFHFRNFRNATRQICRVSPVVALLSLPGCAPYQQFANGVVSYAPDIGPSVTVTPVLSDTTVTTTVTDGNGRHVTEERTRRNDMIVSSGPGQAATIMNGAGALLSGGGAFVGGTGGLLYGVAALRGALTPNDSTNGSNNITTTTTASNNSNVGSGTSGSTGGTNSPIMKVANTNTRTVDSNNGAGSAVNVRSTTSTKSNYGAGSYVNDNPSGKATVGTGNTQSTNKTTTKTTTSNSNNKTNSNNGANSYTGNTATRYLLNLPHKHLINQGLRG